MPKKKELRSGKIVLLDNQVQVYFIREKVSGIGGVCRGNKIYVGKQFEELPREEQLALIYHERGHLNFRLFKWTRIIQLFSFLVSFLCIFLTPPKNITYSLIDLIIDSIIIGTWLICFALFNWFLEIVADLNAIWNIDKKYQISLLKRLYRRKDLLDNLISCLAHPPLKLRIKIMEALD